MFPFIGLKMRFLPNSVTVFFPMIRSINRNENDMECSENNLGCGECSLDPVSEEEKSSVALMTFTFNPSESCSSRKTDFSNGNKTKQENSKKDEMDVESNENRNDNENENEKFGVLNMLTTGNFDEENLDNAITMARKSSVILQEFVRRIVRDKLNIEV